MVFTSTEFIFLLLPATLILYMIASGIRVKNFILLCMSLLFYSWGEPRTVFLVLFSILVNWLFGIGFSHKNATENAGSDEFTISSRNTKKRNKLILTAAVIFNIGLLFIFKYFNFAMDNFNQVLALFSVESVQFTRILLPIGISFYTFQILSYVIDVYRQETSAQKNPFDLGLYVTMFPQLIAGPIVRYVTIAEEIKCRQTTLPEFKRGVSRFMIGFCKKLLISNNVALLADSAFSASNPPFLLVWMGIIAYALQLYFDFSAYSDMAIGMGWMLGFHFLENFNYPYSANSIKDFWRRWHISLSTWFRDYLYIPLGGNRKGSFRTYINLLIVFFITGLWHGASWNFVIWGLYHGVFLILERGRIGRWIGKAPSFFRRLYTLFVVLVGWVFFRAETLPEAFSYLRRMFSNPVSDAGYAISFLTPEIIFFLVTGIFFSIPIYPALVKKLALLEKKCYPKIYFLASFAHDFCVLICYATATLYMIGSDFNPFIYFRF